MEIREIYTKRKRNEGVFSDLQVKMEEQEVKGRKVAIDIEKANIFGLRIMVA